MSGPAGVRTAVPRIRNGRQLSAVGSIARARATATPNKPSPGGEVAWLSRGGVW